MEKNEQKIHICMITDEGYVMPTCVAIQSLVQEKETGIYCIHIIASNLSESSEDQFKVFEKPDIHIDIIKKNAEELYGTFHVFDDSAICVASIAALLKFTIPELFPDLDKILYLDGDLVVKTDLNELYSCDIEEYYAAAVIDSGSIYFKHAYVKMVQHYFNSGVMLLNLKKMRRDNISQKLLQTKKDLQDSSLMDQNVFNLVFDQKVYFLPIRYNFMSVSLERSYTKWTINQINDLYGTNYQNKKQLFSDAAIIHYSSKDKPWMNLDGASSSEWIYYYLNAPIEHSLITLPERREPFGISVIMPCYNTEQYIRQTLDSILAQTFKDFEIICLDDGSTDGTLAILMEYETAHANIRVFANKNFHQGWERNLGIRNATGKYIYFMDSDDLLDPKCFEVIYQCAEINKLDLLYFEGKSFFEDPELEESFPSFKTLYTRKEAFPKVYNGEELFIKFGSIGGLILSPCMQFVRKDYIFDNDLWFPELPRYEDNLYTFFTLIRANRVKCIGNQLFFRRVRHGSTMTSVNPEEKHKSFQVINIAILNEILKYDKGSPMYLAIKNFMGYPLKEWREGLPDIEEQREEYRKLLIENSESALSAFYINKSESDLRNTIKNLQGKVRYNEEKIKNTEKKLKANLSREASLKNSVSFRTGRAITWFPRKVRGGIRCLKEHGSAYTAKRFFWHITH